VFGPEPLRPYIFLAAERVVRERYGVRIPASMIDYSKQSAQEIDEIRRNLTQGGYYDGAPPDLRPAPERLLMVDVKKVLRDSADRLAGYTGPQAKGEKGHHIVPERIAGWVRQFESDDLVDAALRIVQAIRVVGRGEVVASLSSFVESNPEFKGGSLCPFGLPKDSSYVAAYFAADVAAENGLTLRNLPEALVRDEPIVFVDDFIGSGGQAADVIQTWLGLPHNNDLGEERQTLGEREQEALRTHSLGFAFAAGKRTGAEALRATCGASGLTAKVAIHINDSQLPHAFDSDLFKDDDQRVGFRKACERIGRDLLVSTGTAPEKVDGRCLGYGNDAFLVAFLYNTPTQTLTCLWSGGTTNGFDWLPLLPRRKKL